MSRGLAAISLVVSAGAVAGVVFASTQLSRTAGQLERIEARLAAMEKTTSVAPTPEPRDAEGGPGGTDAPHPAGSIETLGDAIREVKRLRGEVETLQDREPSAIVKKAGPDSTSGGGASASDEAMRKVVEDVLAAKEKERVEADKKRSAEWAKTRLERTINDLTERLLLSSTQKDEVTRILTATSAQQQDLWANRKEGENPWEKMQAIRKEQDAAVKPLLTSEQGVKYDEYMKQSGGARMYMTGDGGTTFVQPLGGPSPGGAQPR
jgi:hypothetical protein